MRTKRATNLASTSGVELWASGAASFLLRPQPWSRADISSFAQSTRPYMPRPEFGRSNGGAKASRLAHPDHIRLSDIAFDSNEMKTAAAPSGEAAVSVRN